MKFRCETKVLFEELEAANRFTKQKNSLSIFSSFHFVIINDELKIEATDGTMSYSSIIKVNTFEDGEFCIGADSLFRVIKGFVNDGCKTLEFVQRENKIDINPVFEGQNVTSNDDKNKPYMANISTNRLDRFQELDKCDDALYFSIPQKEFKDMIEKVSFACSISQNEQRTYTQGVLIEREDEHSFYLVATDTRRLAITKRSFEQSIPLFQRSTFPVKFIEIVKDLCINEGLVFIALTDKKIFIKVGNKSLSSDLLPVDFPNFKRVIIPEGDFNYVVKIKTDEIQKALSFSVIFTETVQKKCYFDFDSNGIGISGGSSDDGSTRRYINYIESKDIEKYEDEKIILNFDTFYPCIKAVDTSYLELKYCKNRNSLVICPDSNRTDYFYIVSPLAK